MTSPTQGRQYLSAESELLRVGILVGQGGLARSAGYVGCGFGSGLGCPDILRVVGSVLCIRRLPSLVGLFVYYAGGDGSY